MQKKKKVNPIALVIFGVAVMFFNLWLSKYMADDTFSHFVVMSFIFCGIFGYGFATVYRTLTKPRDDKDE